VGGGFKKKDRGEREIIQAIFKRRKAGLWSNEKKAKKSVGETKQAFSKTGNGHQRTTLEKRRSHLMWGKTRGLSGGILGIGNKSPVSLPWGHHTPSPNENKSKVSSTAGAKDNEDGRRDVRTRSTLRARKSVNCWEKNNRKKRGGDAPRVEEIQQK